MPIKLHFKKLNVLFVFVIIYQIHAHITITSAWAAGVNTQGYHELTLKVLVATIDAQWEGMGMCGRRGTSRHYFPHARP